MDWDQNSLDKFRDEMTLSFNCYGVGDVDITYDEEQSITEWIERYWRRKVESIERGYFKKPSDQVEVYRYNTPQASEGFYVVYIDNASHDQTYIEKMTYNRFKGCTLLDTHQGVDGCYVGQADYTLRVGPGQKKLVIIEVDAEEYDMGGPRQS